MQDQDKDSYKMGYEVGYDLGFYPCDGSEDVSNKFEKGSEDFRLWQKGFDEGYEEGYSEH